MQTGRCHYEPGSRTASEGKNTHYPCCDNHAKTQQADHPDAIKHGTQRLHPRQVGPRVQDPGRSEHDAQPDVGPRRCLEGNGEPAEREEYRDISMSLATPWRPGGPFGQCRGECWWRVVSSRSVPHSIDANQAAGPGSRDDGCQQGTNRQPPCASCSRSSPSITARGFGQGAPT